jgi:tetratricopeptide (TPR) repeat protein
MNSPAPAHEGHSKRIKKLQEIREKLIAGEEVANRQLKTWLGEYFNDVAQEWSYEQDMRLKPEDKPDAIREYEKRLKRAHFQYAKAWKALSKGSPSKTKQFNRTDTAYERVLEYLQEQVSIDPSLENWLDRTSDNGLDAFGTSIDFHGIPRVRTSRSKENQSVASVTGQLRTKRDIKIEVVDRAIEALTAEPTDSPDAEQIAKLKDMINGLKSG